MAGIYRPGINRLRESLMKHCHPTQNAYMYSEVHDLQDICQFTSLDECFE